MCYVGDKLRCLPCNHAFHYRCIGKWLAERSATCPLCKTELFDDEEEESDDEAEAQPASRDGATQTGGAPETSTSWLVNMLNFGLEGGHENLITAARGTAEERSGALPAAPAAAPANNDGSSEPSWWRRLLLRRGILRQEETHDMSGVSLRDLNEPLLRAENGQATPMAEPRPDPPAGGSPEPESEQPPPRPTAPATIEASS